MRSCLQLVTLALALAVKAAPTVAQTTFTVTGVFPTHYVINGQSNPTLTVVRGQTYKFTCDNCDFHPFRVQSTQGFKGTLYLNLISGPNPGTSDWTLTVPIEERATTTLFYQCDFHSPMNGVINVVDPPPANTPTPTPTPLPCAGDCNGDSVVTVDDLLTMVNVALEKVSVSMCPEGDVSGDNRITVDELLTAVNNALSGCPFLQAVEGPPPTATEAPRPRPTEPPPPPPPPPEPSPTPTPFIIMPPYGY